MTVFKKPLLFCTVFSLISLGAFAEDTVPIPPKRPKVMSVSPAYIEQLMQARSVQKPDSHTDEEDILEKPSATPPPSVESEDINKIGENDITESPAQHEDLEELDGIMDITGSGVLDALGGVSVIQSNDETDLDIPIPAHKPVLKTASTQTDEMKFAALETQAGDAESLVSFMMQSDQIRLDDNIKSFLRDHALNMFNENSVLKLEIQSYAKGVEGQSHSDVRVSLARALEVRSFLINNNISPSRLKISPMGKDKMTDTHDRIDLVFLK